MGRLEGKSVVITGAGSGIGRAASLIFTKEGAKLLAVDKSDAVDETVKLVRDAGGAAEAMRADAGVEQDVAGFVGKAVSAYGKLDVIWANAGISGGWVPLHDQTRRAVERDPAGQPDRAVPRGEARLAADDEAGARRLDHLHRIGRGPEGQCRRQSLQRQQGRRDQPGADVILRADRHRHSRQRDLPRPDRDRHDAQRPSRRRAKPARKTRSARSIRRSAAASRTKSRRWDCSSPATRPPTSTARHFRSMAA